MSNYQLSINNDRLPKGYKQTEAGVIPEDWEVKPLKKISPSQSVGLVINPSSYFDAEGTIPMLVGSQIGENRITWQLANKISDVSNASLPASRLAAGDLVTVRVGDPGVTAVVPPELDGCNCASMMIVRQHHSFNSLWLCYVMNSRIGRSQIEHVQYGTAQKQFNISDAINFIYPVPPLPEQKSIAQALSDVDALIAALDKLIAKKRHLKTATMQQLLTGKKRLPGFGEGKGYKQTEVGVIPDDWEVATLGDFTDKVGSGITPTGGSRVYKASGRPFIRSQNVGWGFLQLEDLAHIDEETHQSFAASEIREGDVLLNITGASIGRSCLADKRITRGNVNQHVCIIRTDQNHLNSRFLGLFLLSEDGQRQIDSFQAGGNREGLNFGQIRSFQIRIPKAVEEQRAIATILSDMDTEIAALEARRAKTQALKQGMMQELLTGRTQLV